MHPSDEPRMRIIADAVDQVVVEFAPRWRKSPAELRALLLTAPHFNGDFAEDVHSGAKRGPGGDICLSDINPGNPLWKRHADSFESLAGTDYEATLRCLRVGAETLTVSLNYCWKRRYYRNWIEATVSAYHHSPCWSSPQRFKRAMFARSLLSFKGTP